MLLLDTHILVSLVRGESGRLPQIVQNVLHDREVALFASVASLWEIAIKHRLGKLPLPCDLPRWPAALSSLAIPLMDIDASHALGEADPVPPTKDPFDRLLLAICQVQNMRFLTLDRALVRHPLAWKPGSA